MRIIVFGYFLHSNAGDEQYIYSFSRILDGHDLVFVSFDEMAEYKVSDTDVIIVGGGDLFNDYFMNKLIAKFTGKPNKILGVSVGFPDIQYLIDTDNLRLIDYLFIRTKQDIETAKKHFHPERVVYMPDASIALYSAAEHVANDNDKKIAICLSRHMYNDYSYINLLVKLKLFVMYIVSKGYSVVLVPFNTSPTNRWENDIIIQDDLMSILEDTEASSMVSAVSHELSHDELMDIFRTCTAVVPVRFHACLFSIYTNTPFFPLYSTRKIKNLLIDTEWEHSYEMVSDSKGRVMDIEFKILKERFDAFLETMPSLGDRLWEINSVFQKDFLKSLFVLYKCIYSKYSKDCRTSNSEKTINTLSEIVDRNIAHETQDTIVSLVSFYLTGRVHSPYNYGIKTKMFSGTGYNRHEEWMWIIKENRKTVLPLPDNPEGLFDLTVYDQNDYSGNHRSGWQYVYENIKYLNNSKSELILDMYIDKTFHWDSRVYSLAGVIPYRRPWVGFLHHTFDTEFSDYNCETLLKSPDFIESLKTCKCIFVLSDYLYAKMKERLPGVCVYSIPHPTLFTPVKFSFISYLRNTEKKLISIGGWMRDIHSFYTLDVSSTAFKKVAIKGRGMDNYFPSVEFLDKFKQFLVSLNVPRDRVSSNVSQNISTSPGVRDIQNNWYRHLFKDIYGYISSVSVIQYLDNNQFDGLFVDNVVFLNLVDASAVNTLVECVVRNTPVIVNKHPAVVEVLGYNYPLYMETGEDVSKLLTVFNVYMAHLYMKKINKTRYSIEYFTRKFIKAVSVIV